MGRVAKLRFKYLYHKYGTYFKLKVIDGIIIMLVISISSAPVFNVFVFMLPFLSVDSVSGSIPPILQVYALIFMSC